MGVVSHFRSSSSEQLCQAAQVQNVNFETNRATDQIGGLVCHDRSQGCILPHMLPRFNIPSRRASSRTPCQKGPSFPSRGLDISPPSRTAETVGLASEGSQLIDSGLSTEVVETILHSRAPSTRKLYALKWKVFTSCCSDRQLDPVNCPVGTVLEFLQDRFTAGLIPSTLKVYVAAISAYHIPLGGTSLGETPWYLVSSVVLWGWGLQLTPGCRHGI